MSRTLALHADSCCPAVSRIDVETRRDGRGGLLLHYSVTGRIGDLRIPTPAVSARADELWKHTCFEAFLRPPLVANYYEFNLSPSTQWAAYRFSSYRAEMAPAAEVDLADIQTALSENRFELRGRLNLGALAGLASAPLWRLGVSAVIEETGGAKSYWALAHPAGKPDFHHLDGFVLDLAAAEQA